MRRLDRGDVERVVLLVTDGFVVAHPPEVYVNEDLAQSEGERWAQVLSEGWKTVNRPFPGRWEIGELWVRVVPAAIHDEGSQIWVGTYWTRHGYPEPEAELFGDKEQARAWAITPAAGRVLSEVQETPWSVAASFKVQDEEEHATVHLAKVIL